MTAVALLKGRTEQGIRPFDPWRDLEPVVDLIEVAFGGDLDPAGQVTLERMRRLAHGSALWRWLLPVWGKAGITPGFVWVEEGQIVGNLSLRRGLEGGYLIGNVVVHPDWRERGIASALLRTALDSIAAQGGRWVGLEVRANNDVARGLYERSGFREVGKTLHMMRPSGLSWKRSAPSHAGLREGESRDHRALTSLMRATVPKKQRLVLELRASDYRLDWSRAVSLWFRGRREHWWVVEDQGTVCGAVRALRERGGYPNRLEILVAAEHQGRFEDVLVQYGLLGLKGAVEKKGVEIVLPRPTSPLLTALQDVGFQRLRWLVQMRANLTRYIEVKK